MKKNVFIHYFFLSHEKQISLSLLVWKIFPQTLQITLRMFDGGWGTAGSSHWQITPIVFLLFFVMNIPKKFNS
jgi:galactitol-specific phosphotransferase system IIC component